MSSLLPLRSTDPALMRRHRVRSGFTLIELLVVLAIVSLLIALLLPALKSARQAARTAECMSRMRQVGLVTEVYRQDSNQWYPPNNISNAERSPWDAKVYRFDVLLRPYLDSDPVPYTVGSGYYIRPGNFLICPANPAINQVLGSSTALRKWCIWSSGITNYYNSVYYGTTQSSTLAYNHDPKQRDPIYTGRTLLAAECVGSTSLGYVTGGVAPIYRFHPNETSNLLLTDGHLERTPIVTLAEFTAAGYLWWDP